jgi:2'-5' RNA ligase
VRVFLAIELPELLQHAVAARLESLRPRLPDARYTPAANLHLTLHFFGERTPERVDEVAAALGPVVAPHPPFTLQITAAGSFPPSRPRVLWLGLAPSPELAALQGDVARALAGLRETVDERPFHPHVTLARVKAPWRRGDLDALREGMRDLERESFDVESAWLFESHLGPHGSRHEKRIGFPMAGRSDGTLHTMGRT